MENRYIFKRQPSPTLKENQPRLLSVLCDGEPIDAFVPQATAYCAEIPDGRPRMPILKAVPEDGAKAELVMPFIRDGEDTGEAIIEVRRGGDLSIYRFEIKKSPSLGFVMQFDDRYYFRPFCAKTEYTSSHPDIISVDGEGKLHALALTDEPVTITAHTEEKSVATEHLTVDRVIRAQINIFLITGQSNASGTLDGGLDRAAELSKCDAPYEGTCYCLDAKSDDGAGEIYDLSQGRIGFSAPLGKHWYSLTGEKCLMIQSAVGGSPIEKWIPDYPHKPNLLQRTCVAYRRILSEYTSPDSHFEIYRRGYFWCQGETGQKHLYLDGKWHWNSPSVMDEYEYYEKFLMYHSAITSECSLDFGAIALVRALYAVSSRKNQLQGTLSDLVPVRCAQYALQSTTPKSLFIASRICDIGDTKNGFVGKTGFGYFGNENLHYSQTGYNAQGAELAKNTFGALTSRLDRTPRKIEVLAEDGKPLAEPQCIEVEQGRSRRIAAITLPLYNNAPRLTYRIIPDGSACSITPFGEIRFSVDTPVGSCATLIIESEAGLVRQIDVVLTKSKE